ncbi:(S)-ureidoglycine aminohydrolase [Epibacterium ulvae]|uniref:(S)-ureidoglycine aminohydrolase n=1 Tax=Epibacterium ulvae TaxID=1156985 RepID=A0A1G5PMY8_9RHOB|nr:bifunctional allantoicase/(S)-ureidoglycine aminohydrolase [Epibacterium ulvae]SCZ50827.1 (S)-ureidoglycine aminohydrolase [Epibacterium ulvae]
MRTPYFTPKGGLPGQDQLLTDRAVFTEAYAVIPRGTMRDIVTSFLPGWRGMRMWVLARPMSGFAETFSQYIVELQPSGGSNHPESDPDAQGALFVTDGTLDLTIDAAQYQLKTGGFAYIPAGSNWRLHNASDTPCSFHWIRKQWHPAKGVDKPAAFVTNEQDIPPTPMPDTEGRWATTRFMDPDDLAHDMHVTVVTFEPGGVIPFAETHVMEHGLYVLEGKAVYRLNQDWVEVEAGDFMWLRAFCPQACYAGGPGRFRYLLYKDVNRHMPLGPTR